MQAYQVWRHISRVLVQHWASKAASKDLDGVETTPRAHFHKAQILQVYLLLVQWRHDLHKGSRSCGRHRTDRHTEHAMRLCIRNLASAQVLCCSTTRVMTACDSKANTG